MSNKNLSIFRPGFGLTSFNNFFEPWDEWFQNDQSSKAMTLPKVNISENKSGYNLEVAAPGLHKKDFQIEVNGNVLTISGKKEENKEEKEEKFTRKEYNYSSFSRSFTLPEEVQSDKIEATYDGGILKLSMPKSDTDSKSKQKTIAVK
jgi:HSP20 family protein